MRLTRLKASTNESSFCAGDVRQFTGRDLKSRPFDEDSGARPVGTNRPTTRQHAPSHTATPPAVTADL